MRQTSFSHWLSSLWAVALHRLTVHDYRDAPLSLRSPYTFFSAALVSFSCGLLRTCIALCWNALLPDSYDSVTLTTPPRLYAFPIVATFCYCCPPPFKPQLVPASSQLSQHVQVSVYLSQIFDFHRGPSSSQTSRPLRTRTTPSTFVAKSSGGSDLWFHLTSSSSCLMTSPMMTHFS